MASYSQPWNSFVEKGLISYQLHDESILFPYYETSLDFRMWTRSKLVANLEQVSLWL